MTCGVIMLYYAQHTRPITDFAGIKGPSKIGRRGHLAAARAVNELRIADARLAPAAASEHYACLDDADILLRINDYSATMVVTANFANASNMCKRLRDNKLKRSVINYRVACESRSSSTQDSTTLQVMPPDCGAEREGVFQRGIPFHVYIPL